MIRPACLRALALLPMAVLGLFGLAAGAEQSASAPPAAQTDQKAALAGAQNKQQFTNPKAQPPQTPAQQRYGLPRNPLVGPLVDTDLSKPLTLERAIQIGLQRQNSIAIAQTQAEAAGQRLVEARSSYYPQITPTLQYIASTQPVGPATFGGNNGTGTGTGTSVLRSSGNSETRTDAIAVRQLIFDTGLREANVGFSRRSLFAAEYGVGDQRQSVILNVTNNYYDLLRDRALVRVQQESVSLAQTTLASIQAQVAVGNAAQTDVFQSQADLANAQVALLQAQITFSTQQATLKNAMGVVTSQPLVLPEGDAPTPSPTPDATSLDDYVRVAYANRLDVKQQQENVNAQGYNVRIAKINNGLTVDANVLEGYQLDPDAGEERTFTVDFSYPLFDGGNTRAAVRENKALLEQQRRTLDQLQQTVRLDVEQSYLVQEQARQQVGAAQTAVQAGQTNYDAALEKQKNGLINILDVLNARVQLVTAQVSLIQAIYNFYIGEAGLQRSVGVNDPVFLPRVPGVHPVQVPATPSMQTPPPAPAAPAPH